MPCEGVKQVLRSKRTTLLTQRNINYEAFYTAILGFINPRKLFKRRKSLTWVSSDINIRRSHKRFKDTFGVKKFCCVQILFGIK